MQLNQVFSSMRRWDAALGVGLLAVALVLTGCDSDDSGMDDEFDDPATTLTLAERVSNQDALSTLNTALGATGQAETLGSEDATFTVFAPSNAAFEPYDVDFLTRNTELLSSVLDYHIVQGDALTADNLEDGQTLTTVQGDELEVTIDDEGNVFVEGAQVTTADVEATNGVAHVVDDVLLTNRTAAERLQVTSATEQLYQAIDNAGLADAFGNADNMWTTFAPNNAAFENADLSGFSDSEVQQILQYHVLDGVNSSADLVQLLSDNNGEVTVTTLQGEDVTITEQEDGTIVFNGGEATLNLDRVDQRASNGIIHQIDGLLIPPSFNQSVSYDLAAQSNDGDVAPDGVSGTVTFWEAGPDQTVVTLELDDGATNTNVAHPAHIHDSESGDIAIYLTPIDGSGGGGTSARLVDRPFSELAAFDGYVNIHESVENLGTVVSQGDIGANATGTRAAGLDLVDNPRSETYTLDANSNDGSVAPGGIPGSVEFLELTNSLTFVQVSLNTGNGATGANVSHPAHIHNGSAGSGGDIEYYLSPVDGSDTDARSGKLVDESYDTLVGFDGYVNVHESVANLGNVVSQGNIGANN
ncbi:fasciclin domain-containing protein [Salinibacter ruber]|uniref:fasciclin domain-containing protein n=1 Tax=Salinibacter ruber TaxID=146919 RepID=UPI0013C2F870|nr:fasciclin domain-containing protein [Salinibacter ruber]